MDTMSFYFSTSRALYKVNRAKSDVPVLLDTTGLGAPSALSMSIEGYLLAGFTCGSIAIYHNDYTSPITVWANACRHPVVQIKWSTMYNNELMRGGVNVKIGGRYLNRLCEFFVIDSADGFHIWNLQKNMDTPMRTMQFSQKHESL